MQRPTRWDRHAILAEIKRRHGSLKAFAMETSVSASDISVALGSPYPKGEKAIAKTLGVPAQELWPDRYWPNGKRRLLVSRPQGGGASQNACAGADREAARHEEAERFGVRPGRACRKKIENLCPPPRNPSDNAFGRTEIAMDWVEAMEDCGQALRRVAVMLFALAALAERAALARRPVRCFVLWLLRSAEAAARQFVDEEAAIAGARRPAAPVILWRQGDSPADAICLARRLRALAGAARRLSVRQRRLMRRLLARERERFAGVPSQAPAARPLVVPPAAMQQLIEALPKLFAMPCGARELVDTS